MSNLENICLCLGCGKAIPRADRYCEECQKLVDIGYPRDSFGRFMITLMSTKDAHLLPSDVEILDEDPNRQIRIDIHENVAVKNLYEIWKSL